MARPRKRPAARGIGDVVGAGAGEVGDSIGAGAEGSGSALGANGLDVVLDAGRASSMAMEKQAARGRSVTATFE